MKKFRSRLFSCILSFAVCSGCLPAPAYAAPMEKNANEEFTLGNQVTGYAVPITSQENKTASSLASHSLNVSAASTLATTPVPTEAQARTKMLALKSKYPEGTPYTNSNYYDWNGGIYNRGQGCAGFAFMLSDAAFGDLPATMITTNITIKKVHVGDILRVNNNSHSVIITDVYTDHVILAEGNYNSSVHWGRSMSAAEVAKADYLLTRYPAGTFGDSYELTFDANGGENAPSSQYIYEGTPLTSLVPTRDFYEFVGWATSSTATAAQYHPGDRMTLNGPKKLYAVWKKCTSYPELADKVNTRIPVTLTYENPYAYYQFTAPKTCEYVFESQGSMDTVIELYDKSCTNLLDMSDDINSSAGNLNFSLTYAMTAGETYVLKLSRCSDFGTFTITIKEKGSTIEPTDPTDPTNPTDPTDPTDPSGPSDNYDPFPYAVDISNKLHTKITVNLSPSSANGYYKFTAPKDDTYVIGSYSTFDTILYVYDETGKEIGVSDDVIDQNFQGFIDMSKGDTIYLQAGSYSNPTSNCSFSMYIISQADYILTPKNVKLKSESTGITVSWDPVAGAVNYLILYSLSSDTAFMNGTYTKSTSYTVGGIDSGKLYKFAVIAIDSMNFKSDPSSTVTGRYFTTMKIKSITNTASGLKITWDKKTGAKGYKIYRKSSSDAKYTLIDTVTSGTTLTYTDTSVKSKNGVKYAYIIRPYNGSTLGSGSGKSYYRLTSTSVSTLTNPSAGKMKVTWTKNSKVTAYQIQYSTSSSFASKKTVTVTGAANVSKTISSLTKGKTYYVRIRTYKTVSGTKYYSAWGTKKSIKLTK